MKNKIDKVVGILIAIVFVATLVVLGVTLVLIQDECYAESGVEEVEVVEDTEEEELGDLILDYLPSIVVLVVSVVMTLLEALGSKNLGDKMLSLFTGKLSKIDYSDKVKDLIDYNKALLTENEELRRSINDLVDELRKIKRG